MRKNSDWEKLLKFAKILRSLEQFNQTECFFKLTPGGFSDLIQIAKTNWNMQEKVRKVFFFFDFFEACQKLLVIGLYMVVPAFIAFSFYYWSGLIVHTSMS